MSRRQQGFGLLEVLLALALSLMLLTAASQLFVSAHETWRLQGAAARLQDDARLALQRMAQDIRMAGMFGCLRLAAADFEDPAAIQAFAQPLQVGPSGLSLVVGELPGHTGPPDWTLLTDCVNWAEVRKERHAGSDQTLAFPISRYTYQVRDGTLRLRRRNSSQPLIDHVREMRVEHITAQDGDRVDVLLTLFEPTLRIEQRHVLSVAIRNPMAEP